MAHGLEDEVVQYTWGKSSAQKLIDSGYAVDFKSYPDMGHSGSPEEFRDLLYFMKQRLA
jgi:predicted esterase